MFADDTAVYLAVQGPDDLEKLQNDLNLLQEWEEKWDMEFNPSKCQVLHITRSRRPIRYNYTMHGQTLDSVEKARYLDVDISSDLSLDLKRNIKTTHSGICEAAYKTIVRPQLEYASTTWESTH